MNGLDRLFVVVCALAALAGPTASAATRMVVRSGEHPKFTRLVFDLGLRTTWSMGHVGNSYTIDFQPPPDSLDLSRIFKFIPKKRLLSVSTNPTNPKQVVLRVAKGQMAAARELSGRKLVIDIAAGAAGKTTYITPPETAIMLKVPPAVQPSLALADSLKAHRKTGTIKVQADLQAPSSQIRGPLDATDSASKPVKSFRYLYPKAQPQTFQPELPDVRVLEAQKRLVQQLGRAMSQGIIRQNGNLSQAFPEGKPDQKNPPIPETGGSNPPLNLDAISVFDIGRRKSGVDQSGNTTATNCLKNKDLDVGNWYGAASGPEQIAKFRRNLVGEFDRVDPETLKNLVKFYVVQGFGTEAIDLMKSYPGVLKQEQVLSELAQLIESGHVSKGKILSGQFRCPGAAALWGLLARGAVPVGEVPDERVLSRQLARLPPDLRRRVGSLLMSILLDANEADIANKIAAIIARAPGRGGAEFRFQMARLDLVSGRQQKALDLLKELVGTDTPYSDKALLLLVKTMMKENHRIPDSLLASVSARAVQQRFSNLGRQLRRVEIISNARRQQQNAAFDILTHELDIGSVPPRMKDELARIIFESFDLKPARSAAFVKTVFRYRSFLTPKPSMDKARRHVAEGMVKAGLPLVALKILAPLSNRKVAQDRVLIADAKFEAGQPNAAMAELGNLKTIGAAKTRRKILARIGKPSQMPAVITAQGSSPQMRNPASPAGNLKAINKDGNKMARTGTSLLPAKTLAPLRKKPGGGTIAAKASPSLNGKLTIGSLRSALDASKKARAEIDALLKEYPSP